VYKLIDSHTHLEEVENLELAIEKAKQAGIIAIIAVGSDYESNQRVLEISEKYKSFVYPALGLHPWELGRMQAEKVDQNLRFMEQNVGRAVGIGEIGLDYHKRVRAVAEKDRQKGVYKEALEIARRHQKPAIIHSRYAWKDSFELVKEAKVEKAVFHWYTGFSSVLREIVAEGYFISATPAAEYHEEHRRAVKEAPLERMLLETDSPVEYGKGARYGAEPADVLRSLSAAAELRGMDESTIATQTTQNAIELFGLAL
jgi:TatD DNase family protein